jgi:hypothetical protein
VALLQNQICVAVKFITYSQVGVFAAYVSDIGNSLVDKRLFVPEKWFTEDYRARKEKCKVSEGTKGPIS